MIQKPRCLLLAALLAACSGSSPVAVEGESCGPTLGCGEGLVCAAGTCRKVPVLPDEFAGEGEACGPAQGCGPGLTCEAGVCARLPSSLLDAGAQDAGVVVDAGTPDGGTSDGGMPSCEARCATPPAPMCVNATTVRVHASVGGCSEGACHYEAYDSPCPAGCAAGRCQPNGWVATTGSSILRAVWGSSASSVWAVGSSATVRHFDGNTWTPYLNGLFGGDFTSLHGTAADNIFTVNDLGGWLLRFDGRSWEVITRVGQLAGGTYCVFAYGPGDAFIAQVHDYRATLMRVVDGKLTVLERLDETLGTTIDRCDIVAKAPNDVWLAAGKLLHFDGTTLSRDLTYTTTANKLWLAPNDDLYTLPYPHRRRGGTWTALPLPENHYGRGIWGVDASNVYVASYDLLAANDGERVFKLSNDTTWAPETLPALGDVSFYDLWASPSGEVFVVGYPGFVLRGP